jgi:hypothetical protein
VDPQLVVPAPVAARMVDRAVAIDVGREHHDGGERLLRPSIKFVTLWSPGCGGLEVQLAGENCNVSGVAVTILLKEMFVG